MVHGKLLHVAGDSGDFLVAVELTEFGCYSLVKITLISYL
jgi:hypothetical protein